MKKIIQISTRVIPGYLLIGACMQFLLFGVLKASDIEVGQKSKSIEEIYLSVDYKDKNIEELFMLLSEKTDLQFYHNIKSQQKEKYNLQMGNVSLGDLLRHLSKESGLNFKRVHDAILVEKGNKNQSSVEEVLNNYQDSREVKGKVTSKEDNEGVPGATVLIKGTRIGTVTDFEGNFSLKVPSSETVLVFTSVGYVKKEVTVGAQSFISVILEADVSALEEVVIVGYGEQKKESVIAAITQTNREVLERAGGIQSIAAALTGNLPGVITTASTGMPGEEDPQILIRGASTWNNSGPLVLVDGIERPMNTVDIASVETVSVLKDASATAVYGVRGANGVILITTKRGKEGKAEIRARVNTTIKSPSRLPAKYDSYDSYQMRNRAIEYELSSNPNAWGFIRPQAIINKYRYPANLTEAERYPNVDWQDALFRQHAMAYNASLNISGGTKLVKYFTSADFMQENDLFKQYDNSRGYQAGYNFNRMNVRSNLDFQLTPTTVLKSNLSGSYGVQQKPRARAHEFYIWDAAYNAPSNLFLPQYSDGTWGYYQPEPSRAANSVQNLALSGIEYISTARINTDFTLEQDLGMIVKGLKAAGTLSMDNTFIENGRGVSDENNGAQNKWIDPETGLSRFENIYETNSRFDWMQPVRWSTQGGGINNGEMYRRLFYQGQINYVTTIGEKHNLTAMGLMNRNEYAKGSEVLNVREDWVFRSTYNWDNKYMIEYNGAYTGSEKFSPENRFAFFQSGGVGWMLSRENFMKNITFLDFMKIRANYGQIGDDNINGRWHFMPNWAFGGNSRMGIFGEGGENSPYNWYRETQVGNPNVHWEVVSKANLGFEFEIFKGFISGSLDFFRDERSDILITGNVNDAIRRSVPQYYGIAAPVANLGRVKNQGYEFAVNINHTFGNGLRLWSNLNMTHAKNTVLFADDEQLLPDYQKKAGFQLGQATSHVGHDFYNTWDELYASTIHNQNDGAKLPGGIHILDYNGDGVIDQYDVIPMGFAGNPQNTYNATIGFEWKGFSGFVQFYGVNNVTRQVVFESMRNQNLNVFDEGVFWSADNPDSEIPMVRWVTLPAGYHRGHQYMYDGSYVRLKNAEIGYTFSAQSLNKLGLNNIRLFVNGNNLLLWTKMPDDRESNFAGTGWASQGAYPTVRRFNLGANITF